MPTSVWCIYTLLLLFNQGFSFQTGNVSPSDVQPCGVKVKTKPENTQHQGKKANKPYYLFLSENLNDKARFNPEHANNLLKLPGINSNNVKSRLFGSSLSQKQNQRRMVWGKLGFDLYDLMGNSMNIAHRVARKSELQKNPDETTKVDKGDIVSDKNEETSKVESDAVSVGNVEETKDRSNRKRRSTLPPLLTDDIYHLWYGSHGPPFSLRNSILARIKESLSQLKPVPSKRRYPFEPRGGYLRQSIIPTFGRFSSGEGMMSTNMGQGNLGHLSIDLDLQALNNMLRHRALRRNIHSIMHRLKMRLGNSRAHLTRAG